MPKMILTDEAFEAINGPWNPRQLDGRKRSDGMFEVFLDQQTFDKFDSDRDPGESDSALICRFVSALNKKIECLETKYDRSFRYDQNRKPKLN